MSSPVSPCQWRYRGSGSSEPKGLTHSRKAAFLRGWQSGNVDPFRTPPPAAPPLSALSRGRGGHCYTSATLAQKTRLYANTEEDIATHLTHSHRKHAYTQTHRGEYICYAPTAAQTSQCVCQLHRPLSPQP